MPLVVSGDAATRLTRARYTAEHGSGCVSESCGSQEHHSGVLATVLSIKAPSVSNDAQALGDRQHDTTKGFVRAYDGHVLQRDPDAEIIIHADMLGRMGLYNGSLVQVCNPARPDIPPHLATAFAGSKQATDWNSHAAHDFGAPNIRAHVCGQLSPVLAFNLGLEHHLAPFLDATQHSTGSSTIIGRQASAPSAGPSRIIVIQKVAAIDLQASNRQRSEGVADAMWLAKIRNPTSAIVRDAQHASRQHSSDTEDQERTDGDVAASSSSDHMAAELVRALQGHFQEGPRLLAQGDVFTVRVSNDVSGSKSVLNELVSAKVGSSGVHFYALFKVARMLPPRHGSLLVDSRHTAISLQGSCSSCVPVGATGFADSLAQFDCQTNSRSSSRIREPSSTDTNCNLPGRDVYSAAPLDPDESRLLGVSSDAGWHKHVHLAGVGSLLPAWRQIAELLAPLCHQRGSQAGLRVSLLLHGPSGSGKSTAVHAAAVALGLHVIPYSCHEFNGQADTVAASAVRAAFHSARSYAPAVLLLQDFAVLSDALSGAPSGSAQAAASKMANVLLESIEEGCRPMDGPDQQADAEGRVILVACAASVADVVPLLRRCFTHEIGLETANQDGRLELLQGSMHSWSLLRAELVETLTDVAAQTAGLLPVDLSAIVADAAASAAARHISIDGVCKDPLSSMQPGAGTSSNEALQLSADDFDGALGNMRQRTAISIGAPQVPNVQWEDVGGLEDVKAAILETVELPLRHPHLFTQGLRRRSGVLLYGPPGTGKTLMAKAVATECSLNFLSVKGPELINMYIGESERQVREVFARARRARPCVLFFDELDSLAPARGAGADSGGVMDRVVAQLLAEIDGVQGADTSSGSFQDIFVIGATNRPDLLDRALMRPGRLDKLLYVGVAEDEASKLKVLHALTRKFRLSKYVDLNSVAQECAPTYTGADLYALCADAWMAALKRLVAQAEEDPSQNKDVDEVEVDQCDFWTALRELRPSLSFDELARYQNIRKQYEASP